MSITGTTTIGTIIVAGIITMPTTDMTTRSYVVHEGGLHHYSGIGTPLVPASPPAAPRQIALQSREILEVARAKPLAHLNYSVWRRSCMLAN
jgi:hypothetical protein